MTLELTMASCVEAPRVFEAIPLQPTNTSLGIPLYNRRYQHHFQAEGHAAAFTTVDFPLTDVFSAPAPVLEVRFFSTSHGCISQTRR